MLNVTFNGLDQLRNESNFQKLLQGNIGYLCHSASLASDLTFGIDILKDICGTRLKKLFGPQHGLITDVQDNMIETQDFLHPYYKLPVHSLYGEVRIPTDEMLSGLNTIVIDLQDVGTRVYTYINTMTMLMERCASNGIRVVILDRINPVGGDIVEGNLLEAGFTSFVGRHPIPQRHSLTIGEMALLANKFFQASCDLHVVPLKNWKRSMNFSETNLHWTNPSPNLATSDSALTFVGTVLFEGTNISEGRGTTRSLETIGHPNIEPYSLLDSMKKDFKEYQLEGFVLRPTYFMPTFQKHAGKSCGGFQIHVTDKKKFRPWRLNQYLCQKFYHTLGSKFEWRKDGYEYEFQRKAIDLINGSDSVRLWIEKNDSFKNLLAIESKNMDQYLNQREDVLLYQ